ncbi:MAG: 6-pyruvoyl tetrahydrobiopterin synthase [Lachnospiraceae bacterium]|nr:6-pyruvoyl tetrahydrobiopterin synthase [Lachnospiraceae bacterium]
MKYSEYKFKFYLNASHSIYINNKLGQKHPHTWEITMDMIKIVDGFVQFNDVEYTIEKMLSDYQDKYINEIPPFDTLNPTLENICLHFKDCIDEQMKNMGWLLLKIEISETPTRSYMIDLIIDFQQENGKYLSEKSAYETTAQELEKIINSINS